MKKLTKAPAALERSQQLVLDHFGLEEEDLPELERRVDIEALAKQIAKPTKVAVCNVLDGDGKVVTNAEGPVRVYREVPVKDALKILAKKSLRWLKWWD